MRQEGPILQSPELTLALAVLPSATKVMPESSVAEAPLGVSENGVGAHAIGAHAIRKKGDGNKLFRGTDVLLRLASELLARLSEAEVEQKRVEHALGLSQGYLSHIKAGRNAPSAMLVSELVLLAKDPERRLKELEKFWKRQVAA